MTAVSLIVTPSPAFAEPERGPVIEVGPISYETEADLDAAEADALAAADFDPTIVSDFDLLGRRGLIIRNLGLRQLALDGAADELNIATLAHIEAKNARRQAATDLELIQVDLLAFAVDTYTLSDQAASDRLNGDKEASRRSFTIDSVTDDLMSRVTAANNALLQSIEDESAAELVREQFRAELLTREADKAMAIQILANFEALVTIREQAIKARIEVTLAETQDGIPMVEVGGIRVNAEIGEQLELMLEAALADGIELAGGGYRSRASQIDLRRAHCGTSEFAIFDAPASSCSPPTARPGASQHELGLAVDFTENGSILTWSSPGFFWLEEHAVEYGFINLPSEAWHWSTTGH